MAPRERVEIRDGREFKVVSLPPDPRLQPKRVRERQLFQSLSGRDKRALIEGRIAKAKKRKRRRQRKQSS